MALVRETGKIHAINPVFNASQIDCRTRAVVNEFGAGGVNQRTVLCDNSAAREIRHGGAGESIVVGTRDDVAPDRSPPDGEDAGALVGELRDDSVALPAEVAVPPRGKLGPAGSKREVSPIHQIQVVHRLGITADRQRGAGIDHDGVCVEGPAGELVGGIEAVHTRREVKLAAYGVFSTALIDDGAAGYGHVAGGHECGGGQVQLHDAVLDRRDVEAVQSQRGERVESYRRAEIAAGQSEGDIVTRPRLNSAGPDIAAPVE